MKTTAVLLVTSLAIWTPAAAQERHADEGPTVTTHGEGIVKRGPDRAWVTLSTESRAKTPREAQRLNAEAMTAVLQKLKALGLPSDAIQTTGYDLQPEYDYHERKRTLLGYVARNTVEVRVDDLPKVGEVLDAAVGAGATNVSGIRFGLKDRAGAEREALKLAVEDARERAGALASAAGMRVDRILRIHDQQVGEMPPPRPMMAMAEQVRVEGTPIEGGELEIRASVSLTAAVR